MSDYLHGVHILAGLGLVGMAFIHGLGQGHGIDATTVIAGLAGLGHLAHQFSSTEGPHR